MTTYLIQKMATQTQTNKELRYCTTAPIQAEERSEGAGMRVTGYAALFDVEYDLGPFTEVVRSSAFQNANMADVVALFNHDDNIVLGRTSSGTLEIEIDEIGLKYTVTLPDSPQGQSVYESIRRGDVSQSSWAFTLAPGDEGQTWSDQMRGDKKIKYREVIKIDRVFDVSPVTYPANPDTSVAARSMPKEQEHKQLFTYLDATLRLREIELQTK